MSLWDQYKELTKVFGMPEHNWIEFRKGGKNDIGRVPGTPKKAFYWQRLDDVAAKELIGIHALNWLIKNAPHTWQAIFNNGIWTIEGGHVGRSAYSSKFLIKAIIGALRQDETDDE